MLGKHLQLPRKKVKMLERHCTGANHGKISHGCARRLSFVEPMCTVNSMQRLLVVALWNNTFAFMNTTRWMDSLATTKHSQYLVHQCPWRYAASCGFLVNNSQKHLCARTEPVAVRRKRQNTALFKNNNCAVFAHAEERSQETCSASLLTKRPQCHLPCSATSRTGHNADGLLTSCNKCRGS